MEEALTREQLLSIARLWKRTGREIVTAFDGTSMLPTIEPRQRVLIRCTDDLAPGDVVVSVPGLAVVFHRLVALSAAPEQRWWLFRGDANWLCDPPLTSAERIVGKVERIERRGEFVRLEDWRPRLLQRSATAVAVGLMRLSFTAGAALLRAMITIRRRILKTYARLRVIEPGAE